MSRSPTTTNQRNLLPNSHPGEILLEEFLKPMGLSQNALALAIHVPPRRINEIVLGKRAMTADTDLRLARSFGLSEMLRYPPPTVGRRARRGWKKKLARDDVRQFAPPVLRRRVWAT
jgi:antitoxin HigA-1